MNGTSAQSGRWRADDTRGALAAITILLGWLISLTSLLRLPLRGIRLLLILPGVLLQTFLFTGLFITAHDAMHRSVSPSRQRLNDLIGRIAVGLYALFDFDKLTTKHWDHHLHPGDPDRDPDFHDARRTGFGSWYARFLSHYLSLRQVAGMALVFNGLQHIARVPLANLLLFWVAPSLLSTVQLFLFGTYLPHRHPGSPEPNVHHSTSNAYPPWLSFLTCYHFGYHLEHHEHPRVPWWRLPAVRSGRMDVGPGFVPPGRGEMEEFAAGTGRNA